MNRPAALVRPELREQFDAVPDQMKSTKRWILWKSTPAEPPLDTNGNPRKPRKVPYYPNGQPRSGTLDSPEDVAQLGTFEDALVRFNWGQFTGLGFALGRDGEGFWQGIDLDDLSKHPGHHELKDDLPGYTEQSPGGDGWHALGYGPTFASANEKAVGIEFYAGGRFFTVTGDYGGGEPEDLSGFIAARLRPIIEGYKGARGNAAPKPEAAPADSELVTDLRSALCYLNHDNREEWIAVGHALRELDETGFDMWAEWSKRSNLWPGEVAARNSWGNFHPEKTGYQAVFAKAQRAGWVNPRARRQGWGEVPADEVLEEDPGFAATPFAYRDPSTFPPRAWLHAKHYIRKFVVLTGGTYGVAKSTLTVVDALSMASGRNLLTGHPLRRPLRVWLYNTEDPREEVERKIVAAMTYYGVTPDELGDRLLVDTARDRKLIVAQRDQYGVRPLPATVEGLVQAIRTRGIDVLVVDPLIHSHAVNENDNGDMGAVMQAWAEVAELGDCCVELVHHTRKNNGADATVEDVRGAAAIMGAVRSARLLSVLSVDEANRMGVDEKERRRHLWVNPTGKPSLCPPLESRQWLRLESLNLGNATDDYPDGDSMGVLTAWKPPDNSDLGWITQQECERCWWAIRRAPPEQLRTSHQSTEWIGYLVSGVLDLGLVPKGNNAADVLARVKGLIGEWERCLILKRSTTTKDHKDKPCFVIDWTNTGLTG